MSARLSTLFRLASTICPRLRARRAAQPSPAEREAQLDRNLAERRAGRGKRQAAARRGAETKFQRRMEGLTR